MTIVQKIIGVGLMVVGVIIWSIDYFIVKAMAAIGTWLAELMNAPAGVGTGITIIICVLLFGVLAIVAIAGGFIVVCGIDQCME